MSGKHVLPAELGSVVPNKKVNVRSCECVFHIVIKYHQSNASQFNWGKSEPLVHYCHSLGGNMRTQSNRQKDKQTWTQPFIKQKLPKRHEVRSLHMDPVLLDKRNHIGRVLRHPDVNMLPRAG